MQPLPQSQPRLLVVDDSPSALQVLVEKFQQSGYTISLATRGEEALRLIPEFHPDLVLLDVVMPGMDGFETCRALKRLPGMRDVPVIFMTALDNEQARLDSFEAGGVDYVAKPLNFMEVRARVLAHITLHTMRARLARQNQALLEEMGARAKVEKELRTHQQQLEQLIAQRSEQVIKAETMASLGRLVAGLSHEISNPIGLALTSSTLMQQRVDEVRARMDEGQLRKKELDTFIEDAGSICRGLVHNCERAAHLVDRLREGATDRTSEQRRPFELCAYTREVMQGMAPHLQAHHVQVEVDARDDCMMDSYPGVLAQVLGNLTSNALDHAFQGEGGQIRIALRSDGNGGVDIDFSDNGKGIATEAMPHIFEPFFTTRRADGNSGLGMHIVESLVTSSLGGQVQVDSQPGQGVTVHLHLPKRAPYAEAR